ncbi:hypothetical protein ACHAXR_013215 [Thalassiosira sp. AJA248-18]
MSFYLDDYLDDDRQTSAETCPNCSGTSFYNDPITGALTCSSCYTQSQTATQEELDYDEGIGLAATGGGKRNIGGRRGGGGKRRGRIGRPLTEYDRSKRLPDVESCCLAFQWLLWDASKCVSKLAGIQEEEHSSNDNGYYSDEDGNGRPSIMERTVKKIWFAYLHTWMEATQECSSKYPEMRVSFRDFFLEDIRKSHLYRHLSVTVGRKVENEVLEEMQKKHREGQEYQSDDEAEKSISSTESGSSDSNGVNDGTENDGASLSTSNHKSASKNKKRKRQPFLTIAHLCKHVFPAKPKRHPNGIYQIHPHQAALKIQPSLTLLISILQLALTHLQTGVAPHHLTMWVANGQLPHALNGYALLPSRLKERADMVKKFFMRSFVPPAGVVSNLADMLATACSWYGDGMMDNEPTNMAESGKDSQKWTVLQQANASLLNSSDLFRLSEMADVSSTKSSAANSFASVKTNVDVNNYQQKSLHNVPLLAARMIQDFGLDQKVFNNTMSLMGVANGSDQNAVVPKDGQHNDSDSDSNIRTEPSTANHDQTKKNHVDLNTTFPPPLECASPAKLYTPLHVAAVIVVACKLCPDWERWKIHNLHAGNSDYKLQSSPAFVPWNESQFQLLGNGPTLNHYMDFLDETAFNGVEPPSNNVAQFFQSLQRDSNAKSSREKDMMFSTKPDTAPSKAKVMPNILLSGAPNPNDQANISNTSIPSSSHAQYYKPNNIGRYTSYQYSMQKNEQVLGIELLSATGIYMLHN